MHKRATALPLAAVVGVAAALVLMFFYAPTEALQGEVQRIFYVHVPSAWMAYVGFLIVAAASVLVLSRDGRDWERWDRIASSSAEIGVLFTTIVLTTGPIWGRNVWGVWWVWDARLTSTLVLWLIYVGYLVFRATTPPGQRRARLSAAIGIIGAINIPIVHFAVVWWRTLHPQPTVLGPDAGLPAAMRTTLGASALAFLVLFMALLVLRIRIEEARARVESVAERVGV